MRNLDGSLESTKLALAEKIRGEKNLEIAKEADKKANRKTVFVKQGFSYTNSIGKKPEEHIREVIIKKRKKPKEKS